MSEDLIRRSDALKALRLEYPIMPMFKENQIEWAIKTEGYRKAEEVIMSIPTIEPKRGEWIYCEDDDGQDGYKCSECGFFVPWYYDYEDSNYILDYKVCPNCDASMRGTDDE